MITINLISKEEKIKFKKDRLYSSLKEAVTLLLLFISIVAIMLWVSYYYLENQLVDLEMTNAIQIKSNEDINNRVTSVNKKITEIENIQNNFVYNHKITEKIASVISPGITYQQVKIYNLQKSLEVSGLAKTRQSLLDFKNNLEQQAWITKVDLPMSSLIEKENNQFNIKIEINYDEL